MPKFSWADDKGMNFHTIPPIRAADLATPFPDGAQRGSQQNQRSAGGLVYGDESFNAAVTLIESTTELTSALTSVPSETTGTHLNAKL